MPRAGVVSLLRIWPHVCADSFEACKLVFIASTIGSRDLSGHIKALVGSSSQKSMLPELRRVVYLGNGALEQGGVEMQSYSTFTSNGHSVFMNDRVLKRAENGVTPEDVLNLQFTSGISPYPSIERDEFINLFLQVPPVLPKRPC
jgi:hypothetical protein